MGVHGLTTFVEGNRHFLQDVKFRDSRLVIDGCSLYFRLYFSHGLDQLHGGDYDAFASLLTQFLTALATCNIQPYVVLDGGMDPSNKKFDTLRQRLQSKIKEADNLSHGRNGSVLPILTRDVFIQVLIQSGVPLIQCPAEADWEIACLAQEWKCPVLTNDSDFYIFDLPGGYLPFRFFQWTNLNGKASQRYILARCYTTAGLCRLFGGMNPELLPLCAVLTGNDYGTPKDTETLLSLLDASLLRRVGGRGKGRSPPSRIEGLLLWLSSFKTVAEALEEVSSLMGEEACKGKRGQKGGLASRLLACMQEYHIKAPSSVARWFSGGKAFQGGQTSGPAQLPECLSTAALQGRLPPLVLDALVMRRVLLIPQVENSKLASSHCSSRAIRQAVYGILLHRSQDNVTEGRVGGTQPMKGPGAGSSTVQAQGAPISVEEYDRLDLNLKKMEVEAVPLRNHVHLAPAAVRLGALLQVLGVNQSALVSVPFHLQLPVAVTGFWFREATPTPSQPQVQALVLGMVYGEPNWALEHKVCAGLDRQRVRPGERRGVDIGMAHSFSQWQACLWSALCLNQLLLLPLPEPHLSWLFSGTLVHGLVRYLKGGRNAESLLPGGSLSAQLYSSLLNAVRNCSSKATHSSSESGRRGRGRGRGGRGRGRRGRGGRGRGAQGGGRDANEINNRFALLMSEEESDDDDEHY
uniref:Protein asteroid homolog 1-like n=1 Tax=Pundamilia nyererei TaxID=303518 RepID=A0A3B4FK35_9CICH